MQQGLVGRDLQAAALTEKDAATLKKAREKWSNNKDEAVVEAKKQEVKIAGANKSNLKALNDDLKILDADSYGKLLVLLGTIEALPETQRVSTGRQALPRVEQMLAEVQKFAVTATAGSLLASETEQLVRGVERMASELSVVLLPPAMDLLESGANAGLRKGGV